MDIGDIMFKLGVIVALCSLLYGQMLTDSKVDDLERQVTGTP